VVNVDQGLTPADHAKALAAQRRRQEGSCLVCGTEFVGTTRRRYCSRACADRAFYALNRERIADRRRDRYQTRKQTRAAPEA
jgi:hypothetical protein